MPDLVLSHVKSKVYKMMFKENDLGPLIGDLNNMSAARIVFEKKVLDGVVDATAEWDGFEHRDKILNQCLDTLDVPRTFDGDKTLDFYKESSLRRAIPGLARRIKDNAEHLEVGQDLELQLFEKLQLLQFYID